MFLHLSVSHSVLRGEGVSGRYPQADTPLGRHPPGRHPRQTQRADIPPPTPLGRHPQADTPTPGRHPYPRQTPLPQADTPTPGRHHYPRQTPLPQADTP